MTRHNTKPRIVVSDSDYARLSDLATGALARFPEIAEQLLDEMNRAEVVSASALPADVVRMGSIVEFRSNGGQHRRVELVFPIDADISANKVSVLTPIGTALIGLSAGQSIRFTSNDGREQTLTVLAVD
ncbi:MAG: nucleoside diphosphate kinase regulator [Alphaproteobacteria bacterium]|nr:nucleoside diphosphate kinase regulator [Alphaproteobacteria bacterium]MCW5741921.1 nucleoside diphosphate kinase regulator [Alphaproteobacteria bacterium]